MEVTRNFINMQMISKTYVNLQNIRQRQSFRSYANKQMKESLIAGLPQIASCENDYRRAVKSIMFLLCTAGFFYQTYTFLESFLKYETIQNIKMEYPNKFMSPAITFCNKNRINRELFCKALPDECEWYSFEDFCRLKPKLCNPVKLRNYQVFGVPRNMSHKYNISNEFLETFGQQTPWDFLRWSWSNRCNFQRNGITRGCKVNDSMLIQIPNNGLPFKCFTMYSLLGKPDEEPRKIRHNDGPLFWFHTWPEQYMDSKDSVQLYMYVHDPRMSANPMAEGIALNGGYSYRFSYTVEQRQSLPPPYDTQCVDYVEKWKENGGRGPITKKDCIEQCKIDRMMEQRSCVGKSITYPHSFPICSEIIELSDKEVEKCSSGCREACDVTLYKIASENGEDYTISSCREQKGELRCKYDMIKVALKFGQLRIQRIFVEPKYQNVELFSYIGGFMGLWLGICLVTFIDFLEMVADISAFAVKKLKKIHTMKKIHYRFQN